MRLRSFWIPSIFVLSLGCSTEKEETRRTLQARSKLTCPESTTYQDGICLGKVTDTKDHQCPEGTMQYKDTCQGFPLEKSVHDPSTAPFTDKSLSTQGSHSGFGFGDLFDDDDTNENLHWNAKKTKNFNWYFHQRMLGYRVEAKFIKDQDSVRYSMELTDNNASCPMWYPELKIDERTGILSGTPFMLSQNSYETNESARCEIEVTARSGHEEIKTIVNIYLEYCKDCKITNKFAVLNYSPYRDGQTPLPDEHGEVIMPSLNEIEEDIQNLKQLTNAIRTYEIDLNVLEASYKFDMGVHLGAYLVAEQGHEYSYEVIEKNKLKNLETLDSIIDAANDPKYKGVIKSLIIGNEIKLHNYMSEGRLVEYINYVREKTEGKFPVTSALLLGPGGYGQLGPSDYFGSQVDYILYHHYPFWERLPVRKSKHSIIMGFKYMRHRFPHKELALGETGWATQGATYMTSETSEINQAIFINDLFYEVNTSYDPDVRKLGKRIMYFQAFDESWKIANNEGGTLAAHWGIFDKDRKPKLYLKTAFPDIYN